jgi:hypothetical protein
LLAQLEIPIVEASDNRFSVALRCALLAGVGVFAWLFGPVYQGSANAGGDSSVVEPFLVFLVNVAALTLSASVGSGAFNRRYNSLCLLRRRLEAVQVNLQKSSEARSEAGTPHDSNIQERTISGS